jgi:hypothetical protein
MQLLKIETTAHGCVDMAHNDETLFLGFVFVVKMRMIRKD